MAESLCSGSAPSKRLLDHQNQDRALQQDRFAYKGEKQQNFRRGGPAELAGQQSFDSFFQNGTNGLPKHLDSFNQLEAASAVPVNPPVASELQLRGSIAMPARAEAARALRQPQLADVVLPQGLHFGAAPGQGQNLGASPSWTAAFHEFNQSHPHNMANTLAFSDLSSQNLIRSSPRDTSAPTRMTVQANWSAGITPSDSLPWGYHLYGSDGGLRDFSTNIPHLPQTQMDFRREMSSWVDLHGDHQSTVIDAAFQQVTLELSNPPYQSQRVSAPSPRTGVTEEGPNSDILNVGSLQELPNSLTRNDIGSSTLRIAESQAPAMLSDADGSQRTERHSPLSTDEGDYHEAIPDARIPASRGSVAQISGDTDVSKAAGKLLASVDHEEGTKWKNSHFLALMRDFRDGRKGISDGQVCHLRDGGTAGENQPV